MSERRAKRLRKEAPVAPQQKKPVDKSNALFNAIAAVLIVVVAVLAGIGIWNATRPEIQTFAAALESQGTTFDAAVTDWGLDTEVFSAEMPAEEASMLFTLENMAKMEEKELADYIKEKELPEDVPANVPSKDLSTDIMLKANGIGMSLEEMREFGLSEDITGETPWSESNEEVINAFYAALTTEAQAQQEQAAEGEE